MAKKKKKRSKRAVADNSRVNPANSPKNIIRRTRRGPSGFTEEEKLQRFSPSDKKKIRAAQRRSDIEAAQISQRKSIAQTKAKRKKQKHA